MQKAFRFKTFAATVVALITLSFSAATANAATTTVKPKPATTTATPDSHPVPYCPPGDPNGCGIYSN